MVTDAVVVIDEEGQKPPPPTNPNGSGGGVMMMTTASRQQAGPPPPTTMTNFQPVVKQTMTNPGFTSYKNMGRTATGLQCPHCGRQTVTQVRDLIGVGTVIWIIILAILFWPLCWLPLCIPSCKRTHHYCGHAECGRKIGETSVCA